MTRFQTLSEWLAWQETLHPTLMDFGLERPRAVLARLLPEAPPHAVLTVAGTNGKGSSVAMLEAILAAAGFHVGTYTSPHIVAYNERIRIGGVTVSDEALCAAFAAVDEARGDTSLTYFEFGTLAAFWLFARAGLDVAVLEIGLGGRLDAVNLIDADASLVTAIGLDHLDWLGPDRESVGYEKAGIYRPGRPAVCSDPAPPQRLIEHAAAIGADLVWPGQGFEIDSAGTRWSWHGRRWAFDHLPLPALAGSHQIANAGGVLALLEAVAQRLPVDRPAIETGLTSVQLAGRFQVIDGPVSWVLDVTHNADGAAVLANTLRDRPVAGRTLAVFAMLADKDAVEVGRVLAPVIQHWYAATLDGPRGRTGRALASTLAGIDGLTVSAHESVASACAAAWAEARAGDRIVVFGSFHTVGEALAAGIEQWTDTDLG